MTVPLTAGNGRVKEARKLSRRSVRAERRLFLVDGPKGLESALEVPDRVVEVFATAAAFEQYAGRAAAGVAWTLVDDRALASLSEAVTPQGIVAVCRFLDVGLGSLLGQSPPVEEVAQQPSDPAVEEVAQQPSDPAVEEVAQQPSRNQLVVCADVRDPGNAGTIIRTADAVGAAGVVLAGNSVDPYNDKTVRATVGSLFHVPLCIEPDVAETVRRLQQAGFRVLAADGGGEVDLFSAGELLEGKVAWLFGNEAWGLPAEIAALADHRVSIPIPGRAESLNLSTAAAVCLYAGLRARP